MDLARCDKKIHQFNEEFMGPRVFQHGNAIKKKSYLFVVTNCLFWKCYFVRKYNDKSGSWLCTKGLWRILCGGQEWASAGSNGEQGKTSMHAYELFERNGKQRIMFEGTCLCIHISLPPPGISWLLRCYIDIGKFFSRILVSFQLKYLKCF